MTRYPLLVCATLICASTTVFAENTSTPAPSTPAPAATTALSNDDAFKNLGLSLKAGTAGLGFDVLYAFDPHFDVRAGFSSLNFSHTINKSNLTEHGNLQVHDLDLLADYRPWAAGFRITAGLNNLDVKFKGHAEKTAAGQITLNGVHYSATELGSADLDVKWNGAKPYLGIGYDGFNARQSAGFYFTSDFGVIFSGSPHVNLTTTCIASNPTICNNIDQDTKAQEDSLKKDLHSVKWLPILQLGLGYRF